MERKWTTAAPSAKTVIKCDNCGLPITPVFHDRLLSPVDSDPYWTFDHVHGGTPRCWEAQENKEMLEALEA